MNTNSGGDARGLLMGVEIAFRNGKCVLKLTGKVVQLCDQSRLLSCILYMDALYDV